VPGAEFGDVIVEVITKKHDTFTRKGADLVMHKTITLLESLTGVDFSMTHLDGRIVRIKSKEGQVV